MSHRDPRITLAQIRDAAEKARSLCAAHTLDSLLADWKMTAALERCIEIVGEGVRRLPNELKQRHKDIPWKDIAGTRDHLIHGYDLIDHRVLWDAVQIDIPRLIEAGLLHKHARGAVGAPAMLPGQMPISSTATQGVAAQAVTVSSDGVDPSTAATGVAGSPGSVAGCPVMPLPDGMMVGGVTVDGIPVDLTTVDVGSLPSGTVVYVMPPPGHHGGPNVFHQTNPGAIGTGNVDVGAVDMGGVDVSCIGPAVIDSGMIDPGMIDSGMVNIAVISPGFDPGGVDTLPPVAVGPPMLVGQAIPAQPMPMPFMVRNAAASNTLQTTSMQTTSAAAVPTTDSAARAMAGGFPNRAVGLRADALGGGRNHGRGVPATAGSVVAVSGDDAGGAVVQAGGAAAAGDGAGAQATGKPHGGIVRAVGGGPPVGVPGSAAAPRWRDRIRFAWPGAK